MILNDDTVNYDIYLLEVNLRFILNDFPNTKFNPKEEGYKEIKEPDYFHLLLLQIPVIISNIFCINIFLRFRFGWDFRINIFDDFLWVIILILVIPIHELLHTVYFPDKITSPNIIFGYYKGSFFALYMKEMKRIEFLSVLIFPFIILTLIPILSAIIFNLNFSLLFKISLINSILSGGDIISFITILKQVPKKTMVRNKGYYTYWKK